MKKYTVIANWKSYFTFQESVQWIKRHHEKLAAATSEKISLGLCPSFESLSAINNELVHSTIKLGAQDCSAHAPGGYTGQINAASLKETGCQLCIIGHSETRNFLCQTNELIAGKLKQLIRQKITPIICIGESIEERESGNAHEAIEKQLTALKPLFQELPNSYIAYEPIWAIGTGKVATPEIINQMCTNIKKIIDPHNAQLLYGGSVKAANIDSFKDIESLDGFLIGKASTAFDELQKIMYTIQNWEK